MLGGVVTATTYTDVKTRPLLPAEVDNSQRYFQINFSLQDHWEFGGAIASLQDRDRKDSDPPCYPTDVK
jgi:hypothetical protein